VLLQPVSKEAGSGLVWSCCGVSIHSCCQTRAPLSLCRRYGSGDGIVVGGATGGAVGVAPGGTAFVRVHMAVGDDKRLPTDELLRPLTSADGVSGDEESPAGGGDGNKGGEGRCGDRGGGDAAPPSRSSSGSAGHAAVGGVLCNWTLHFIGDEAKRRAYLQSLFDVLAPGGVLVSKGAPGEGL